jgi:ribosomal protein S20
MADGRLSYCAKAVPSSAATYEARVQQLTKGASKQVLADVRKSEDYRRARESIDDFVSKVDQHNARNVCHETAAQRK